MLTTLLLPLATGTLAVALGFGDTWGMGSKDPLGTFITAALPILPPGLYQILAWPLTYGVALLFVPLAAVGKGQWYVFAMLVYLAALAAAWSFNWVTAPDYLNLLIDGASYVPGRLNSNLRKFGVYLLTDSAFVAVTVVWWRWRR